MKMEMNTFFLLPILNCLLSSKWAWLRLGLYQMKHEDLNNAISSLQAALRLDPTDRLAF
jgi:tetratricopeptide (TPR) repeat protein